MTKFNLIVGGIAIVLLFTMGFVSGWHSHKRFKPCPEITHDTIKVTDPYWHHIADSLSNLPPEEVIKWLPQDTLFIPNDTVFKDVDTMAILRDYYSIYTYDWTKNDDTLGVVLKTTVTKNQPIAYDLKYKIFTPFTTTINNVDNSITYNSYLQFGLDIPIYNYAADSNRFNNINDLGLELTYSFPKGYIGAAWVPNRDIVGVRFGTTLCKFKKKR
jgi:hypothetical protein